MDEPWTTRPTEDLFDVVKAEYGRAEKALEKDPTLTDKKQVLQYHSPTGEVIDLVSVRRSNDSETLLLLGWDAEGNECQIVAHDQAVQLVMKIIPRTEQKPDRKPIGYVTPRDDQEDISVR